MLERARTTWSIALALLVGCTPTPSEVAGTGVDAESGGTSGTTTGDPPNATTEGSATGASADGTGSEGTTMALDGGSGSTTTGEPATTSSSSEGSSSSGDAGDDEDDRGGSTTTGEPVDCHPLLAEVLVDAMMGNNNKQWVRIYNPCDAEIELDAYVLAWGGDDYMLGQHALQGSLSPGDCWVVGGPNSSNDNANPVWDQNQDFSPDMQLGGKTADAVALFLGAPADVMLDTVPLDAVIYGDSNDNGLLDANGDTPEPHVGNTGEGESIRRTALGPEWEVAQSPTPNECPAL